MALSPDHKRIIDEYLDDNQYSEKGGELCKENQPIPGNRICNLANNIKSKRIREKKIETRDIIDYICTKYKLSLNVDDIYLLYTQDKYTPQARDHSRRPLQPPPPTVDPGVARENRAVRREMLLLKKALRKTTKEKEPPSKKQRTR